MQLSKALMLNRLHIIIHLIVSLKVPGVQELSENAHINSRLVLGDPLQDGPTIRSDRNNTRIKDEELINALLRFEPKAPSELKHDVVDNKHVFSDPTQNVGPGQ